MRRVVVTGIGVISSIGDGVAEVTESLCKARSGVRFCQEYANYGFRSQVVGAVDIDWQSRIDRRKARFMGQAAAFTYLAFEEALADSGLDPEQIQNERYGIICGSGGGSNQNVVETADTIRNSGVKRVGPYRVTRTMGNTTSAIVGTFFGIKGVNYSISSACATSAHCIGNAYELIQMGKQDVVFAGGGEEVHWSMSGSFDAMGALSSKFNATPETASRAYDQDRDGFVISGGGGIVVLEDYKHAKSRGATIYAEIVGYSATSDGYDMVAPSGEGAERCMRMAIADVNTPVQYVNVHGTSTPVGDIVELEAMANVFGKQMPMFSSTKSLTGHALGAAGANEAIYTLLMLKHDFVTQSAHIDNLDKRVVGYPLVLQRVDNAGLKTVMSNSFGFGGTNASLVFRQLD